MKAFESVISKVVRNTGKLTVQIDLAGCDNTGSCECVYAPKLKLNRGGNSYYLLSKVSHSNNQ